MTPLDLFKAGKLSEAMSALSEELRRDPTNVKNRTFLFELLCFSGEYDRAEKHLDILAQSGPQSEMGAVLYRGLLNATRTREDVCLKEQIPQPAAPDTADGISGTLNGIPFKSLTDADSRIGSNLEVFAAGSYLLIPFSLLASIEVSPPRRLRDMLWTPAVVRTTPAFQGREVGEAFLPTLTPFSYKNANDAVRLGRETVWEENKDGEVYPVGQRILLADGEEVPILELRKLEFAPVAAAS